MPKWKGSFQIVEKKGPINYVLRKIGERRNVFFVAYVIELKPYTNSYVSNVYSSDAEAEGIDEVYPSSSILSDFGLGNTPRLRGTCEYFVPPDP